MKNVLLQEVKIYFRITNSVLFRVFCGFVFFNICSLVYSQDEEIFSYPLSAQTTESFRASCALIAQNQYIRGNFNQEKKIMRLDRTIVSSGVFIIASDMGMVWDTLKPYPSTITLGKDYMIQSRRGGQRTVIDAKGNETFTQMAKVLNAVFTGDANELETNFEVFYTSNSSAWEIGLKPLSKSINMFAKRITVTGDSLIKSIVIIENNEDSTKYILSNHNVSGALTENEKNYFKLP
jgi:hypothetical protein